MEQETKKISRSIKIYPIFASFTGDLIFFLPIDTLFLTLVKGLNASQITAMTMVALIICIVFQKVILAIIKKIGNVNSLRLGATMLLIASLVLTFGKSFISMLLYKRIIESLIGGSKSYTRTHFLLRFDMNCFNSGQSYNVLL